MLRWSIYLGAWRCLDLMDEGYTKQERTELSSVSLGYRLPSHVDSGALYTLLRVRLCSLFYKF